MKPLRLPFKCSFSFGTVTSRFILPGPTVTVRAILYGFLLWLIPFIVGFVIYPIRGTNRALFETIMPLTLTIGVVFFSILYFRKINKGFLSAGIRLGVIAFILSILIDLLLFLWGPMKMSFADYMMDIGLTYLIYPNCDDWFWIFAVKATDLKDNVDKYCVYSIASFAGE